MKNKHEYVIKIDGEEWEKHKMPLLLKEIKTLK